tara:strand:- start:17 stop:415 length:399 start_codon:yes stop_codon:yes gene_type:complete
MSDNDQKEEEPTLLPEYDVAKTPFSWDKLDGLLAYKANLTTCEEILGVHQNTIKNHIKSRYGQTFTEYQDRKLSVTKLRLVQKAIKMAENGSATMLIFCLKNICKWVDKVETTEIDTSPIQIEIVSNAKNKD